MTLPREVASRIESHCGTSVLNVQAVGGGCIANASRVVTTDGPLFVKWGGGETAATFPAEAAGLRALRTAPCDLVIPEPIIVDEGGEGSPGVLVLEWIEPGARGDEFWKAFGAGLAAMHRHTGNRYGFDRTNFIGRLPQSNVWRDSWPSFYRSMRIEPQVRIAREAGRWKGKWDVPLERFLNRLDELLPERPEASIVHGDLWSGNFLVTVSGKAALIDPAAYWGHREADLAMSELFGGFDRSFYAAYRDAWPLEPGYEDRREAYNLYHLINHLNHFGGGYAGSVEGILRRF